MSDDYFRDGGGYRLDMQNVLLGGPVTEWFDRGEQQWHVAQEVGVLRWEGTGESRVAALLDLIAQRMEVAVPHRPRRGSDVEQWLKRRRDEYGGTPDDSWDDRAAYLALDALLDDYRLRADVAGVDLATPVEQIGPHPEETQPAHTEDGPDRLTFFDKSGNSLTARWVDGGVQVAGVLFDNPADADRFAAFITREDEGA